LAAREVSSHFADRLTAIEHHVSEIDGKLDMIMAKLNMFVPVMPFMMNIPEQMPACSAPASGKSSGESKTIRRSNVGRWRSKLESPKCAFSVDLEAEDKETEYAEDSCKEISADGIDGIVGMKWGEDARTGDSLSTVSVIIPVSPNESMNNSQSTALDSTVIEDVVGVAPCAASGAVGDDDVCDGKDQDECVVALSSEEVAADPWMRAKVLNETNGITYEGQVEAIEVGHVTRERLYLIRYRDGDVEHMTRQEVRDCQSRWMDTSFSRFQRVSHDRPHLQCGAE